MRTYDDVTALAFLLLLGDEKPMAGLLVANSYQKPSNGLLQKARIDGLPEMRSVERAMAGERVLPGWGVLLESGTLGVVVPHHPRFVEDCAVDLPGGWAEAAGARGAVLLAVVHPGAWDTVVADFESAAQDGYVLGGLVGFDRVVHEPVEGPPTLRIFHSPMDHLLSLAQFVNDGVMTLDEAMRRVRDVQELSETTPEPAWPSDGAQLDLLLRAGPTLPGTEVRGAYAYARMLTEITEAQGGTYWERAADLTVEHAVRALGVTGDMRLFRDADAVSRRRIAMYRRDGETAKLGWALVNAARLHLAMQVPLDRAGDAYAEAEPGMMSCRKARRTWRRLEHFTEAAGEELDALEHKVAAIPLLEEAASLADDATRARLLVCEARMGARPRPGDAFAAAMVKDGPEPACRLALLRLVTPSTAAKAARIVFAEPPDVYAGSEGTGRARDVVSQGLQIARDARDRALLSRVLAWADQLGEDDDTAYLRQVWEARLHLGEGVSCSAGERKLAKLADRFRDERRRPPEADVLHLAAHIREAGLADLGQQLLIDHGSIWRRSASGVLAAADLHALAATCESPSEQWPHPQTHHAYAAARYSEVGLFDLAGAHLALFRRWLREADDQALRHAVAALMQAAPSLYGSRDRELAATIRNVAHALTWQVTRHIEHMPLTYLLYAMHCAKGAEFARWYGARDPLESLPRAIAPLLSRCRQAEAEVDPRELASPPASTDLLTPLEDDPPESGATEAEIVRNQRRFTDRLIDMGLLHEGRNGKPLDVMGHIIPLLQQRNLLDDRTVLLAWFVPEPELIPGDVVLVAFTRDHNAVRVVVPDGSADEQASAHRPLTDDVRRIRAEIVADPLFDDLTPDARRELADNVLLTGSASVLEACRRQGKDRLILWPHGSLHFFPFHLCSVGGRTIADDWTVTSIPSLSALVPQTARVRPRRTAVIASALGGTPFGLTAEDLLEEHACEVAATAGVPAIVGPEATRHRLLRELADADVIHIAAHGTSDPAAPWFHCLYLSPDQDDDGRVFAHDLLSVDLRGVRLVTLAACDSALGRFDLGDNLRGIPGALLASGAEAIVGCLWPVRPEPATAFFADLHRRLGSASVVDAFRGAQLATRAAYPQYRDWGAFSLIQARITTS
ncbi:CHAT domain-containing protein [Nonomuraea sp. N2-4H]|uniref:CHAT domain-containing protein n=1 Tax=Nonomuraea sp. N2-4H TaxID=3128898 RepID=UPI003253D7E9